MEVAEINFVKLKTFGLANTLSTKRLSAGLVPMIVSK